jgi:hypothetical protein
MKGGRKAFDLLRAPDFERSPIWLVELPKRHFAIPVEPFDELESDEPYVALTTYTLHDGTPLRGFCFIYDCSGHVVFGPSGEPIPLCDYGHCSAVEASSVAKALARSVEDVFPLQFRASVKVFGRFPEGEVGVQSNNPWRGP